MCLVCQIPARPSPLVREILDVTAWIAYHVRLLTNGHTKLQRIDVGNMDRPMVMDIEYQN